MAFKITVALVNDARENKVGQHRIQKLGDFTGHRSCLVVVPAAVPDPRQLGKTEFVFGHSLL